MGRHPELLIPASSLEVLKTAVIFGADAVYIGGEAFGLRAKAKNFSMEEMKEGIGFAHERTGLLPCRLFQVRSHVPHARKTAQGGFPVPEPLDLRPAGCRGEFISDRFHIVKHFGCLSRAVCVDDLLKDLL